MPTTPPIKRFSSYSLRQFNAAVNFNNINYDENYADAHDVWELQLWELLQRSLSDWANFREQWLVVNGSVNNETLPLNPTLRDVMQEMPIINGMCPLLEVDRYLMEAITIHQNDDPYLCELKQIFVKYLAEANCSSLVPSIKPDEFLRVFERKPQKGTTPAPPKHLWANYALLDYYWSRVRDHARACPTECAALYQLPREIVFRLAHSVGPQIRQFCLRMVDRMRFRLTCPTSTCSQIWATLIDSELTKTEKQQKLIALKILKSEQCIQMSLKQQKQVFTPPRPDTSWHNAETLDRQRNSYPRTFWYGGAK